MGVKDEKHVDFKCLTTRIVLGLLNHRKKVVSTPLTAILLLTTFIVIAQQGAFGIDSHSTEDLQSSNFMEVNTIDGKKIVETYSDTIVIKNLRNSTLDNVRLMLSPHISRSFYLDTYAIKSIEPNGNATVTINIFGDPDKDTLGKVTAYDGKIMVMTPNHNPVILPLKINSIDSEHYQAYIQEIEQIVKQRSRIPLINTILANGPVQKSDVEVTTRTGSREINSPSDDIVIRNTSDRTLNNVRLIIPKIANAFLLEQYHIPKIDPDGEVTVRMISKIDTSKYNPRDYRGEVIIAPDNGRPIAIPIYIAATQRPDSADEFEVRVAGFNNEITTGMERIHIKNVGERTMDSVKIILSEDLLRAVAFDKYTFKTIEPNEEVTVAIEFKIRDLNGFMQSYEGEIIIASEHHNLRSIPIKIEWYKVESDNFVIHTRSVDMSIADDVSKYLEDHYKTVASAFGTIDQKATIYVTSSMEELKLINYYGHSFYSYSTDAIFVCSCDNPKENALQEFIYRAMIKNLPGRYHINNLDSGDGNWLIDGMAKYSTVKNNETATLKYTNAFKEEPVDFQWYGIPTDVRYGATITFLRYLEETYGEDALYRSLYHLGSGMVNNDRCDTLENCAILGGIYDTSGLIESNKKYDLDFNTIVKEWASDVENIYGENFIEKISWETKNSDVVVTHGNPAFVNGQDGSGLRLSFDGSINRYLLKNPFNGFASDEVTAAFWMKSSDTTKAGTPISYAKSAHRLRDFVISDYGNFNIFINNLGPASTGVSANDGKWHHIMVTWKSSSGEIKLFKDGIKVYSGILAQGEAIEDGGSLVIGQERDVRGGFKAHEAFLGLIDDIYIYNKALSDTELLSLFNDGDFHSESKIFNFLN